MGAGRHERQIVDRLSCFASLGVTCSAAPIPPMRDAEEYLD